VWLPFAAALGVIWLVFYGRGNAPIDPLVFQPILITAMVVAVVLTLIFYPVSAATLLYATFQDMRDGKVRIWAAIKRGFARVFWVILLIIVGLLALVAIGAVVSVLGLSAGRPDGPAPAVAQGVPALMIVISLVLAVMWCVAIPVCVVERLGPIRSLGRSRRLTQGYRWKLLAIFLITVAVVGLVSVVLSSLLSLGGGVVNAIGVFVVECVLGAFWFVVPAVTYHDLRLVKEGVDIEKIAAIFD
jgi:hypothetical protein